MSISKIQSELVAPKNQKNSFGNYKYRSAEDIVEAVKPVLKKYGYHLIMSDEVEEKGERVYIKATASLYEGEKLIATATGWAREPFAKKGMDESQITGAASSYARKYSLCGLLAIDDNRDADTDEYAKQAQKPVQKVTKEQSLDLLAKASEVGADIAGFLSFVSKRVGFTVGDMGEIPAAFFGKAMHALEEKAKKGENHESA